MILAQQRISLADDPEMILECLFSQRDREDADVQIMAPRQWNKWLLDCATAIYNWAIRYARDTLRDKDKLSRLQANDLPIKWAQYGSDITSDLNWIYMLLSWDKSTPKNSIQEGKINFLHELHKRGNWLKIQTFGVATRSEIWDDGIEKELGKGLHDALIELIQAGKRDLDWILASQKKEW